MRFFFAVTWQGFALTVSVGQHEVGFDLTWHDYAYVNESGYATLVVGPLFLGWPTQSKRALGLGEY